MASNKTDVRSLLTQRFLEKLQRISNQIDFITKYSFYYQELLKYYKRES